MAEQKINVNTATAEALTQLPGIGPVLADRIAAYRGDVGLFEEPAQITMVSGIGERTYRAIADRLTVTAREELSKPAGEAERTSTELATEDGTEEWTFSETDGPPELGTLPGEEIEPVIKALRAGESMAEEELAFGRETEEEAVVERLQTDDVREGTAEEAPAEVSHVTEEPIEEGAPPEALEVLAEGEEAPEVEEQPAEEPTDVEAVSLESEPSPADAEERPQRAPSRSWWRRLSWLWTALLGGLLGMAFALVVFSAVNGSLDVGHSRAVVDVRGRMDSLATDISSLQSNVDGLRKRLDALEELTVRMDRAEARLGDLQEATVDLNQRADVVEKEVAAVATEVEAVSEQVATLEDQAEKTRSFFQALQTLLADFFGEIEGESMVTPTPEGK